MGKSAKKTAQAKAARSANPADTHQDSPSPVEAWFDNYGWEPFPFQREAWAAYARGESGLIHAPTGMGKTYAAWLGPVGEWLAEHPDPAGWPAQPPATRVLWITPLRALATDTTESLLAPVREMGLPWSVQKRTGDTSASVKAKQRERLPTALVTTPESLSLLLTQGDARERLSELRCIVVDEWHELLGTKRGVQTELCLARLRAWNPRLRTWGLSATLGNNAQALAVLLGSEAAHGQLIRGLFEKQIRIETLLPSDTERIPWGGHLGLKLLPRVIEEVEKAGSTLLFTNTRSQAELWFNALTEARPDLEPYLALHHGSLDREVRNAVEDSLRAGALRCVVCTSSLDLGVDFSPVDLVIQVGSPKGIARLLQRAGRSGHQPGATSRVLCVPTNALEIVEFSASRAAAQARRVEAREPLSNALDVLVQHLVTVAIGGGFVPEQMLAEVRSTHGYRDLSDAEWGWCLDFISRGGSALRAYPQFQRVAADKAGVWRPTTEQVIRTHRLGVGTITAEMSVTIRFQGGGSLGQVEEGFVARMKPGDNFLFAGRPLQLVRLQGLTATVRPAPSRSTHVPRWLGGRLPLSTLLADAVRDRLVEAKRGVFSDEEMRTARVTLELQERLSRLPEKEELLIEIARTREGHHAFLFAFEGRLVHEGLSILLAYRIARAHPRTITTSINDYGIELTSQKPMVFTEQEWRGFLSRERLVDDLMACLNETEMAKRQFRDIARIAGLINPGFPGNPKTGRQLQVSSGLLYDVFRQFDPTNRLLDQARREVLQQQLEINRLARALERLEGQRMVLQPIKWLTPLSFPLWAEMVREQVSTEAWVDRVQNMVEALERVAGS